MLSTKEIADYAHGQARSPEEQGFTFSEATKIEDALIMRRDTLTDLTDVEPPLPGRTARTGEANTAREVLSRLRTGPVRKMSAMKRNLLLIMLFLVVFAVTFALESWNAPAKPGSTTLLGTERSTGRCGSQQPVAGC